MKHYLPKTMLAMVLTLLFSISSYAQAPLKVKGRVIDNTTKEGIIGAAISVKGTSISTITDVGGNYSLSVPNANEAILVVYMFGYQQLNQAVEGKSEITFELVEDAVQLGDVVVVGYGSTKRKEITGSIATVKMDELPTASTGSVANMLQGRAAGLQIQQNSAKPGSSFDIQIRGSISGTSPLIVIDGIPQVKFSNNGSGTKYSNRNREGQLIAVNPNDIESVDILKDASAASIYGSDAAGGVILITTKKGREGKLSLSYSGNVSIQTLINRPEYLSVQEFMVEQNKAFVEVGRPSEKPYTQEQLDNPPVGTDWYNEITRLGITNDHNISMQGGSAKTKYLASLSYFDQIGVVKNSSMSRWTGRVNLDQEIAPWLKAGINSGFAMVNFGDIAENAEGGEFSPLMMSAMNFTPTVPIFNANGEYSDNPFRTIYPNPVSLLTISDKTKSQSLNVAGFLEAKVFSDLTIKATVGIDQKSEWSDQYIPTTTKLGYSNDGIGSKTQGNNNVLLLNAIATYNKVFAKKHNLSVMAGFEYKKTDWDGMSMTATKFPTDNALTNNMGSSEQQKPTISSYKGSSEMASVIGRLAYSYDSKYMFTFNVRVDGSSNFATAHQWGVFPGLSAAWALNNEPWLKDVLWINMLKIRVGAGQTGNAGSLSGIYSYYNIRQNAYAFNGNMSNGAVYAKIGNPNLKWETLTDYNVGVDFSFFNGRLGGSVDLYQRTRTDVIMQKNLMSYNEVKTVDYNSAVQYQSRGLEISLNSINITTPDFEWTTNINFSTYENRTTHRDPDFLPSIYQDYNEKWGNVYKYASDGLIQKGEKLAYMPNGKAGAIKYKDLNGYKLDANGKKVTDEQGRYVYSGAADGILDAADLILIGNNTPMPFSINNTFRYRNWDLNIYLYGNLNGIKSNNIYAAAGGSVYQLIDGLNVVKQSIYRYSDENPNGWIPGYANTTSGYATGDGNYFYEKSWYLRLDNVSLGHTFRPKGLKSIRLYGAVRNLLVITPYKGMDPETGDGTSPYPSQRTYMVGLEIKF